MGELDELVADVRERGLARVLRTRAADLVGSPDGRRLISGDNFAELVRADPELAPFVDGGQRGLTRRTFVALSAAGVLESQLLLSHSASARDLVRQHVRAHPTLREADGGPVRYFDAAEFRNWGRTVRNTPAITFVPRTKRGVREIVRWAVANDKRVRAAGYRHTWSDLYAADGQVLISMLPPDIVENLPTVHPPIDPQSDLQGVEIVGTVEEDGVTKALCRIGAATTNEQFRQWCLAEGGGAWRWTVPLNVIMVEITWGGSNAPICHGAGRRHETLSDLVTELEFVNARGRLQRVSDPKLLRTAAGCFGLLGIVTSITLKLDPMTFASFRPTKPRLALAVPPPAGFRVPRAVDMSGITPDDLEQARRRFVAQCENDYYAEWFWFPYQPDAWVNCWHNDGPREEARPYPDDLQTRVQESSIYLMELSQNGAFRLLPGRTQAELFGAMGMATLPGDVSVVTPVIEALHFQRGIQNFRVLDMEFEIPIPPRADDRTRPDWSIAQRAWWDVIRTVHERADAPMRVALEMRIMGGSKMHLAPQRGNRFGTCSIEVLTNQATPIAEWNRFMQDIADLWTSYKDPRGRPLNVRPHWAKQWQDVDLHGQPAVDYLRGRAYARRIPRFRAGLRAIAKQGGYKARDLRRFSTPLLDELFGAVFK